MTTLTLNNSTPSAPKVCILGASLDSGNLGVRALAGSLVDLILGETDETRGRPGDEAQINSRANARIQFLYGSRAGGERVVKRKDGDCRVEVVNCRMSPRAAPHDHIVVILVAAWTYRVIPLASMRSFLCRTFPWIKALHEADFVGEIRGGDSFSDIYGLRRFLSGVLPVLSVAFMGKPYVLLPQTYGPFDSGISKRIASYILRHSSAVYRRDEPSAAMIQALTRNRITSRFSPDVAFTLESRAPAEIDIEPALDFDSSIPVVALNVSGLLYMGGYDGANMFGLESPYPETIHALVAALVRETEARILLFAHVAGESDESDSRAIQEVAKVWSSKAPGRVHRLCSPHDEREIKAIIGRCDFIIASRMHACIASLSQGIPALGLAYSDKFAGVFSAIDAGEYVLDARALDSTEVTTRAIEAYKKRHTIAESLEPKIANAVAQVKRVFEKEVFSSRAPSASSEKAIAERAAT